MNTRREFLTKFAAIGVAVAVPFEGIDERPPEWDGLLYLRASIYPYSNEFRDTVVVAEQSFDGGETWGPVRFPGVTVYRRPAGGWSLSYKDRVHAHTTIEGQRVELSIIGASP